MKFSALFAGSIAGALAAVAAFVLYDLLDPSFYLASTPILIVALLWIAGAQTLFVALPALAALNHWKRLNAFTAILTGAFAAAIPWLLMLLTKLSLVALSLVGFIALFGAFGGLVGYITARAISPNNSFKPTPLRGVVLGSRD